MVTLTEITYGSEREAYFYQLTKVLDSIKAVQADIPKLEKRFEIELEHVTSILESIYKRLFDIAKAEQKLSVVTETLNGNVSKEIEDLTVEELKEYKTLINNFYDTVFKLKCQSPNSLRIQSLVEELNQNVDTAKEFFIEDKKNHVVKETAIETRLIHEQHGYGPVFAKAVLKCLEGDSQPIPMPNGGKDMNNIEKRAEEISLFLDNFFTTIIKDEKFRKIYSDVGTLEDKLANFRANFSANRDEYKNTKDVFGFDEDLYRNKFKMAGINLRKAIQQIDKFTIEEVLPALKNTSKKIQSDVFIGKIEIQETASLEHDIPSIEEDKKGISQPTDKAGDEPKSAFDSKVNRLNDWIDKASEIGKTVEKGESFYSKYGKYIVKGFKYLITLIL